MAYHARRQTRPLPSIKRHGLAALLVLLLVFLTFFVWAKIKSDRVDVIAINNAEIPLPEYFQPELEPAAPPLPDLLESDNIPLDANPTEIMELAGAEKQQTSGASGRQPSPATKSASLGSKPKTILIDGSPVPVRQSIVNRSKPLTRAPIAGLNRNSTFGPVPFPASDGRTAFSAYAKPFTPVAGKSYISLVVGGLGINQVITRRAISELPGEVTLSFAAETPNLQMWVHQARARGHEVLIELPMESTGHNPVEPGATYTLMSTGTESTNSRNLDYLMSRAEGYFAVTNYGGDRLMVNDDPLKPILSYLSDAGLGLLYDGSAPAPRLNSLAKQQGLKTTFAQSLLDDNIQNRSSVRAVVSSLKPVGSVKVPIGMGFSYPSTIDGIKDWIQSKPVNTELAPVSYAMNQNQ